jgi:hypothetical protein
MKSNTKTLGKSADAHDHEKHVFKYDCFVKCAWESRTKFKLYIEALDSDS